MRAVLWLARCAWNGEGSASSSLGSRNAERKCGECDDCGLGFHGIISVGWGLFLSYYCCLYLSNGAFSCVVGLSGRRKCVGVVVTD